ncbi:MAG: 23S rRNA (guanosine(2251)-2'-O)-methyltransferase RlmB [Burkholderiales bacterium]
MDIIYGRNAVKSAIKSARPIDKLLAAKEIDDPSVKEILALASEKRLPVVRVDKRKLDNLTMPFGYGGKPANHQGVVAMAAAKEYGSIEDIMSLAESRNEPPFMLILDGITDEGNLGSIIRSAEVLGAHGVILGKRRSASLSSVAYKASSGAAERLPIVKVTNLSRTIKELKEKGVWITAADVSGKPADEINLKGPVALVIGSEGEGISRLVLENCDLVASIPMKGETGSLNAAVAAAVLMYEKARQEKQG